MFFNFGIDKSAASKNNSKSKQKDQAVPKFDSIFPSVAGGSLFGAGLTQLNTSYQVDKGVVSSALDMLEA